MARATDKPLHEIACRSCGIVFRDHRKSRAYCQNFCRIMLMEATLLVCTWCGDRSGFEGTGAAAMVQAAGSWPEAREAYKAAHRACRAGVWEGVERDLGCRCKRCRPVDDPAPEPVPATKAKSSRQDPRRSHGYRKHAEEVFTRDGYICQICLLPTDPTAHPSDHTYPNLDHVCPIELGGGDEVENLRTTHRWCNISRNGSPIFGPLEDEQIRPVAQRMFAHLAIEPRS